MMNLTIKNIAGTALTVLFAIIISAMSISAATFTVTNTNDSGAGSLSPTVCVAQPPNLVSWYKGENNALDSADGNNGTIQGNVTFTTGKVGQTFTLGGNGDLNGNGDRVIVGNPANLRLQNFTIEAWIKRSSSTIVTNSPVSGFDHGTFFAYGQSGYGFFIDRATNRLGLTHINVSNVTSNATVTDTNFHHVAVTKSGNQVTFYVDGVASAPVTYNPTFTFATNAAIGARGDDNAQNAFFGSIDELSIYNRALSLAEIQSIAAAGPAGKCNTTPGNNNPDTAGVFRPSNGITYLRNSNTGGFADIDFIYGNNGDTSIAGDWDGDGKDTLGIYRNGLFYLRNTNSTGPADIVFAFGDPSDQPIAGDWDGDGIDTIGLYRRSTGVFILRNSNSAGPPDAVFVLGNPNDIAIAGDWDGDGIDTTGVFRPSNGIVFLKNTNVSGFADISLVYGNAGDKPLAGDWDGDGFDSVGIYRNGVMYLRNSNTQGVADIVFAFGDPGDEPIAGDWDGLP